jgi:hypothetical protein
MITSWPLTDPFWPLIQSTGGPVDTAVRFQADVGPEMTRRRTTAVVEAWNLSAMIRSAEDLATFEAWWLDDLAQGTMPFLWRHPASKGPARVRFSGAYALQNLAPHVWMVAFPAVILPGRPWYFDYIPRPYAAMPEWVADYENTTYGIEETRLSAATGLSAITGTFMVWERRSNGTESMGLRTFAADVPQTAPTGVLSLVGFAETVPF